MKLRSEMRRRSLVFSNGSSNGMTLNAPVATQQLPLASLVSWTLTINKNENWTEHNFKASPEFFKSSSRIIVNKWNKNLILNAVTFLLFPQDFQITLGLLLDDFQ